MPQVIFQPSGVTVEVEPGTNVLEAARRAGIRLRNDCGGEGLCGKCRVEVRSGDLKRRSTALQLPPGVDLACRLQVGDSTAEIYVPEQSYRLAEEVSLWHDEAFPDDYPPPSALVRSFQVSLPEPSLDDNRADRERLLDALGGVDTGPCHVPLQALRSLPVAARDAGWHPYVTLAVGSCGTEVRAVTARPARPLILAVDIGTTTIKARLVAPGNRWSAACYNSQSMYGPDVISRIIHCQRGDGGLERLQQLVVADINRLLSALCERSGVERHDVWAAVASGNTTMIHLLLGMVPLWIRREPYVGCAYQPPPVGPGELGIDINPAGTVFCLPSTSAYVGADIGAGVLATGLHEADKPSMLIDLGTNGEIVVGCRDFMACCSASAGPAFEGGSSASGCWAGPGAVHAVWADGDVAWQALGNVAPLGICGSGYIDLLATLAQIGVIDKTGRFREGSSPALRRGPDDGLEFVLVGGDSTATGYDILLSQGDIENLIRAKAAIYAAGRTLLANLGMDWSDLATIMLAGGFGESINIRNAIAIGLLPDVPEERIEFVGNTSLKGAVLAAVDAEKYQLSRDIMSGMTYLELSTRPEFMEEFVSASFLPHTDVEKFPSVTMPENN